MPRTRRFDIDWRRLFRWCLLGTIVMLLWLLAPVVKCSWIAFRDTPIGEVDEDTNMPGQADKQRIEEGTGFFDRWGIAIKGCYRKTPLLGQEPWKKDVLFGFAGMMALAWSIDYYERRRKRTYG
jgi:hypothetical protein